MEAVRIYGAIALPRAPVPVTIGEIVPFLGVCTDAIGPRVLTLIASDPALLARAAALLPRGEVKRIPPRTLEWRGPGLTTDELVTVVSQLDGFFYLNAHWEFALLDARGAPPSYLSLRAGAHGGVTVLLWLPWNGVVADVERVFTHVRRYLAIERAWARVVDPADALGPEPGRGFEW